MTKSICNTTNRTFKHLSDIQRGRLEEMAKQGDYTQVQMAKKVHTYRKQHPEERVPCTKTVYTLIDSGVLSIKNIDLPKKTCMRPRKKHRSDPKGTNAKHLGQSIAERDPSVLSREEPVHWEVDLVLSKKTKYLIYKCSSLMHMQHGKRDK